MSVSFHMEDHLLDEGHPLTQVVLTCCRRLLSQHLRSQGLQFLSRLGCFRTARVAVHQFLPSLAVVAKSLFAGVENESDALPVVTIKTVVVEEVSKHRRATRCHLLVIKSPRGIA